MAAKRYGHSTVTFRENIYVLGGFNFDDLCLPTTEVIDIKTEQFTSIEPTRVPRYSFSAAITELTL